MGCVAPTERNRDEAGLEAIIVVDPEVEVPTLVPHDRIGTVVESELGGIGGVKTELRFGTRWVLSLIHI